MFKLFSAFRKDKVWDFNGGIHPPEMKTQSNGTPLRQVSLPTTAGMLKGLGLRTRSQEAPGGEDHRIVRMTRVLETFYREKEETGTVGR